MNDRQPVVTLFENPDLNEIGAKLIELYKGASQKIKEARKAFESATHKRWQCGRYVANNIDIIEQETTQREFAEVLGITEAMVSNDKRAFLALKEEGAENWDEAKQLMAQRGINSVVRNWEKLPKLLNQSPTERQKDKRAKDEKRLENLHEEIEEIRTRNEGANPALAERAEDTLSYSEAVIDHVKAQDVFKSDWRSRDYLDFVRSIGFDYITGKSCENPDPHHCLPRGAQRGPDGKLADFFTIPVSRPTHNKLETGQLNPKPVEIAEALIRTLALYIKTHKKSD